MTTGTRRTIPSRSGLMENSPRPAAACSTGSTLRSKPGKVSRNGRGSGPRMAKPVCSAISASVRGLAVAAPACPTTTIPACLIASASTASLLGRAASLSRVASSRPRKLAAATAGDRRSGSANTMSKPMATAPSARNRVTRSATTVRGHGHCPISFRLASSISAMTTGRAVCTRGRSTWKRSKVRRCTSSSGRGSAMRSGTSANRRSAQTARATPTCRAQRTMSFISADPLRRARAAPEQL